MKKSIFVYLFLCLLGSCTKNTAPAPPDSKQAKKDNGQGSGSYDRLDLGAGSLEMSDDQRFPYPWKGETDQGNKVLSIRKI